MQLSGNTVLLTGGSSGIGRGLAAALLERGNHVIITGRHEAKLRQAQAELAGVTVVRNDVSDLEDIGRLYQRIAAAHPDLNVLINNAGVMLKIDLQDATRSADALTRELDVNAKGPIWMNHAFLPLLKQQPEAAIVNVTAGLAYVPLPISPIASAAKAALHSYTLSLREQLRNTRVKVFELVPPATKTSVLKGFTEEDWKGAPLTPIEDVVAAFVMGFEKDRYEIRPGPANQLRFMSRFFPNFILGQLSKNVDLMHAEQSAS